MRLTAAPLLLLVAMLIMLAARVSFGAVARSPKPTSASSSSSSSSVKYSSPRKLGSIAFVVNTGSSEMQAELASLQRNIKQIQTRSRRFKNLLISFYGGGRKQQVQKSSSSKGVISFVQSASVAKTAKQCKQPAMTAIAESVLAADRNSIVIHITDAAASDSEKKGFAACLARYKNTRVFTVVTGSLCATNNADDYEDVAAQTRGAVLRIDEMFIDQVLEMIVEAEERIELFTTLGCFKPKPRPKKCTAQIACQCGGKNNFVLNTTCDANITYGGDKASLGIVLDATGSMTPEYKQIHDNLEKLILSSKDLLKNFVLSEFNDPYEKRVLVTKDPKAAVDFLAETFVIGGGDCPEPAYHAIRDVANALSPGSVMFVFTDASANDARLKEEVEKILQRKNIVLNVVSTGDMCKSEGKYNSALGSSAAASKGKQLKMDKSLVDNLLRYIRTFSRFGLQLIRDIPGAEKNILRLSSACNCSKRKLD